VYFFFVLSFLWMCASSHTRAFYPAPQAMASRPPSAARVAPCHRCRWGLRDMESKLPARSLHQCGSLLFFVFILFLNYCCGILQLVNRVSAWQGTMNKFLQMYQLYTCAAGDCNNLILAAPEAISPFVTLIGENPKPAFADIAAGLDTGNVLYLAHVKCDLHGVSTHSQLIRFGIAAIGRTLCCLPATTRRPTSLS
jgi:hypothetical protein